ncbi:Fumble family protein [Histomonas meleagridis]|uniref:Fumble family protein n=1 Tax=Histomonas meleagridis TaxID=135588 RepID=UPI00355969A3|nr:Fumble family protein [Histomonas meleagridis]KAH0796220.1 Fumble family protein [Histomonas meleagridis]
MLGLDIGATLTKFCFIVDGSVKYYFVKTSFEDIQNFLENKGTGKKLNDFLPNGIQKWTITGCGSHRHREYFEHFPIVPSQINDSQTILNAIPKLFADPEMYVTMGGTGKAAFDDKILVAMIGTGVSFFVITNQTSIKHFGGTSIGGGTFLGMSNLLFQNTDFEKLISMAKEGNPDNLDLLISDIVGGDYTGCLKSDVVASSMAKSFWSKERPSDIDTSASLIKTISIVVGSQIASICNSQGMSTCVLIGGFMDINDIISNNVIASVNLFRPSLTCVIPKNHLYFGAFGAAINNQ